MLRVIEGMLTLACGERGIERWEPFGLAELAAKVVLERGPEAGHRGISVATSLSAACGAHSKAIRHRGSTSITLPGSRRGPRPLATARISRTPGGPGATSKCSAQAEVRRYAVVHRGAPRPAHRGAACRHPSRGSGHRHERARDPAAGPQFHRFHRLRRHGLRGVEPGCGGGHPGSGSAHRAAWAAGRPAPGKHGFVGVLGVGTASGLVQVGVPAFAIQHGSAALSGVLLACISAGNPLGGLLVLAGLAMAPVFISSSALLDNVAPMSSIMKAFSVVVSALVAGISAGTAAGGAVAAATGPGLVLLCSAAAMAISAVWVATRLRPAQGAGPQPAAAP